MNTALALALSFATSQCSGGSCPVPFGPVVYPAPVAAPAPKPASEFYWVPQAKQYDLYRNGAHVGSLRKADNVYMSLANDKWSVAECPAELPKGQGPVGALVGQNYGIDLDKMRKERNTSYSTTGHSRTRQQAFHDIAAGTVADDSARCFVTVLNADKNVRDRVAQEWKSNSTLADAKATCHLQIYDPSSPMVKDMGFLSPAVYVQAPDGLVLARIDGDPAPEILAGAIRKADPKYDPKKDRDPTKDQPLGPLTEVPVWGWVVGGLAVLLLLKKK